MTRFNFDLKRLSNYHYQVCEALELYKKDSKDALIELHINLEAIKNACPSALSDDSMKRADELAGRLSLMTNAPDKAYYNIKNRLVGNANYLINSLENNLNSLNTHARSRANGVSEINKMIKEINEISHLLELTFVNLEGFMRQEHGYEYNDHMIRWDTAATTIKVKPIHVKKIMIMIKYL